MNYYSPRFWSHIGHLPKHKDIEAQLEDSLDQPFGFQGEIIAFGDELEGDKIPPFEGQ